VESNDTFEWIDDLNIVEIIDNDYDLSKILSYIYNKVKDLTIQITKENSYSLNDDNPDMLNIEYYRKKHEITEYIATSKNPFDSMTTTNSKIFNTQIVSQIIIEEFMNIWKQFKISKDMQIELVNNNIFVWSIKYRKFKNETINTALKEINKSFGYDFIELQISFHAHIYPNYPPTVKIMRPRLKNSLMHKLTNTKMIQLAYWTPARDTLFIIHKIYNLIDKHAVLYTDSDLNDTIKFPNGSFCKLENQLIKLASFVDNCNIEDIDEEKYEKVNVTSVKIDKPAKTTTDTKYWASGTGYGHSGCSTWDINAHVKAQEERDKQIRLVLKDITIEIQESTVDQDTIYNNIKNSLLIPYLKNSFNGVTFMEISKHIDVYRIIFNLISSLINEKSIFLFHDTNSKPLFKYIEEMNDIAELAIKFDKLNVDEIAYNITTVYNMLKPLYIEYVFTISSITDKKDVQCDTKKIVTQEDLYISTMHDLKFDSAKISGTNYYYQQNLDTDKNTIVTYQKRMVQEFTTLKQCLPIHYEASIFARSDNNNMSVIRALMIGPKDTPYEGGCFIFDIYIPVNYPASPPSVWYITHGGKRFNPNLYDSGKVCLSLIGTWPGDKGVESWNSKTSSLYQVLISIQCQILTENPYFNEPGYEQYFGTSIGEQLNRVYNNNIRYFTMCHTIRDLLVNIDMYPQFSEVIKKHFYLKKNKILEICDKWTNDAKTITSKSTPSSKIYGYDNYKLIYDQIVVLINKLT
jgi:ubiquitin-protein ligase